MTTRIRSSFAAVCVLATTLALMAGVVSPGAAFAAVSAVYTAPTNPTYENPVTGAIEDSAGTSNVALGESMVSSIIYGNSLIERDTDGAMYASLRFKLADQISGIRLEVSRDGSSYGSVEAVQMQTGTDAVTGTATADYRLAIPSETAIVRCTMDVIPMGRSVICFVSFGALQAGDVDGTFVQSVVPGEGVEDVAAVTETPDDKAGAAEEPSSEADSLTSGSSNEGVQEFDEEGREVTGDRQSSGSLDSGTVAVIVGGAAAVAVLAGAVVYVAHVRPKRARQAAAAAAAAAGQGSDSRSDAAHRDAGRG